MDGFVVSHRSTGKITVRPLRSAGKEKGLDIHHPSLSKYSKCFMEGVECEPTVRVVSLMQIRERKQAAVNRRSDPYTSTPPSDRLVPFPHHHAMFFLLTHKRISLMNIVRFQNFRVMTIRKAHSYRVNDARKVVSHLSQQKGKRGVER